MSNSFTPSQHLLINSRARDASHFSLNPSEVVIPENLESIKNLIALHNSRKLPFTFRAGGTSLSGQGVSAHSLFDVRKNFKKIEVLDGGVRVRVEPGATVREVNNRLLSYGYRLGPDPASEVACTIGGVIANNSSGMLCGTQENTYQTIESLKIIFADGFILNTSDYGAETQLRLNQPEIYKLICATRDLLNSNADLKEKISAQFAIKNTMGYGLNSFIDFTSPIDILLHLIVGSEGTLAFIAEATFRTVPLKPHACTSLIIFDSLKKANESLEALIKSGADAIELLDATSLRVAQSGSNLRELEKLSVKEHSGLIVEYQDSSEEELMRKINRVQEELGSIFSGDSFNKDLESRARLWHVRKGLYANIAGARRAGTTALLEDVAVPVPLLTQTCQSLTELFRKYQYEDSVIFGHAKDGNIHFMLNENFTEHSGISRYEKFTNEMVELVLNNKGTLKAEHGTGRVMAPFVHTQYGDELYAVMKKIKQTFDPHGVFNPDVIITSDKKIHLKNFKEYVEVSSITDACVECGFCESICPSKDLTLTPRQRIVTLRAANSALMSGNRKKANSLFSQFNYAGSATCAVDGLCQTQCPVGINTGDLVKVMRADSVGKFKENLWKLAAHRYGNFLILSRIGVQILSILPRFRRIPLSAGRARKPQIIANPDVIFLPTCTNELFNGGNQDALMRICERVGIKVYIPENINGVCCGTPWRSKGLTKGEAINLQNNQTLTTELSKYKVPVVVDSSSCTEGFIKTLNGLNVIDVNYFLLEFVIKKIKIKKVNTLMIHPTCSSEKVDRNAALIAIAQEIANEVIVPPNWGCCGFAGDRGLIHPELTESATQAESEYVKLLAPKYLISNNRTCEMAMTSATGMQYSSALQLLQELL